MEMLLFYTPGACSLAGQIVLEWIGEPYRLCRVGKEERGSALYRKINPQGKVPALRSGTRIITENAAILLHLAAHVPMLKLVPDPDSPLRDPLHQWLSYFGSGLHVAFFPYFRPERYLADPSQHAAVKAAAQRQIAKQLQFVDDHLAGNRFVLGDMRTILDPYLYAMARWGTTLCDLPSECPHLAAHMKALEDDPGVQFVLSLERDEAPRGGKNAFRSFISLQQAVAGGGQHEASAR